MTGAVSSMTLVERWCGKNPSVSHLRVYGYVAWAHIPNDCKKKLDAKSHACIMMGYSEESTTYLQRISVHLFPASLDGPLK
jgi:hypothetical protein